MPPQLMLTAPASASTNAADSLKRMTAILQDERVVCVRGEWRGGAHGLTTHLRARTGVARLDRMRRLQQPQSGNHQPIGLAGERRGENRVTLGIARELLGQGDELLALGRRTAPDHLGHGETL